MCLKNPTERGKDALLRNNLVLHLFGVATRSAVRVWAMQAGCFASRERALLLHMADRIQRQEMIRIQTSSRHPSTTSAVATVSVWLSFRSVWQSPE
jgi:hypothetical protein